MGNVSHENGATVLNPNIKVTKRVKRARCKMCGEAREVEVDTWDDRVEPTFEHDCKGKGPKVSHPVTREGDPIPFFPVNDKIIVQRIPEEAMQGMFYVPDSHKEAQQYGTVIAAGPRAQGELDDMGIAISDTICFGKFTGVSWNWIPTGKSVTERREVLLISVKDILGGKELAEKMIDGRLGVALYRPLGQDGKPDPNADGEYRFFEEVKP